jgi:hypothetical protein
MLELHIPKQEEGYLSESEESEEGVRKEMEKRIGQLVTFLTFLNEDLQKGLQVAQNDFKL